MATWPESSPTPNYPLVITPRWRTQVSEFEGGGEQRRQKSLWPVFDVSVNYKAISKVDCQTLYAFFMARRGRYEAFYIYDLSLLQSLSWAHEALYVGIGDGSATTFDLPGRSTSSQSVYLDGTEQTGGGTDYSILTGGGVSSADRVQFNSAPTAGQVVSCDFTGFARYRVRFEQDTMPYELFEYQFYRNGSISLKGLPAA